MKKQQRQILLRSLFEDLGTIIEAEVCITSNGILFCNGIVCQPKQYACVTTRCNGCPLETILTDVDKLVSK